MTIETRIATAKSYPKVAAIINSIQDILEARYGPVHNMEMIRNLVGRFVSDTERAHCIGKLDKLKTFENVAKSVIGRAKSIGYLLVPDGAKPLPLGSKPTMSRDKKNNCNLFEVFTPSANSAGNELFNLDLENLNVVNIADRILVVTEDKATEILRKEVKVDAGTAYVLIVPETALQSVWNDEFKARATEIEVVVQKRGTTKVMPARAWMLQLGPELAVMQDEDVKAVVEAAETEELFALLQKRSTLTRSSSRKCWRTHVPR